MLSRVQVLPLMRAMPEDKKSGHDKVFLLFEKKKSLCLSNSPEQSEKWSYFMYNNIIQGNFAVIIFPLFHLLVRRKAFSVGQHMVPSARLFLRVRPS